MTKVDYRKELRQFYGAKTGQPVVVQIPKLNFIMIDGKGDPNTSQDYIDAIQTLYAVAYTVKFMSKLQNGKDYTVMPLEGLWWSANMEVFGTTDKSNWFWTAMIMQPEIISEDMYNQALQQVKAKKSLKSVDKLRFETYDEGRAAQVLYVGPYSGEGPTIQKLHEFIEAQGGALTRASKHHHEIYMGDPRRTDPAKLKTIIRQPF